MWPHLPGQNDSLETYDGGLSGGFSGDGRGRSWLARGIELADHGDVLVVTKESLGESNTHYAQGGIAVAD